jgi:hypothetical protein
MSEPLRTRIETRVAELEALLETIEPGDRTRIDVENALRAVARLTTGDMDRIPTIIAKDLANWLETSKYLGRRA